MDKVSAGVSRQKGIPGHLQFNLSLLIETKPDLVVEMHQYKYLYWYRYSHIDISLAGWTALLHFSLWSPPQGKK